LKSKIKYVQNYNNHIFNHGKESLNYSIHPTKYNFFNHLKKKEIFSIEEERKIDIEGVFSNAAEY
jgi:hypothetical protein